MKNLLKSNKADSALGKKKTPKGTTYISMNSTFCNFELNDGNFVIDKFTVCTPITPSKNKLGGFHRDGCSVGTNGKQSVDRQYTLEGKKKKSLEIQTFPI